MEGNGASFARSAVDHRQDDAVEGTEEVVEAEFIEAVTARVISEMQASSWSAPLPDPASLKAYNELVPDAADRIIKMAESSTTQRAELDKQIVNAEIANARNGRNQAFALTAVALVASVMFFAFGKDVAGGILLSMPVTILIRSFIARQGSD